MTECVAEPSETDDRTDTCNARQLEELVRLGDAAALDRLTRCYGERLLKAGRRHCRTPEEAADAVQDTLLIARDKMSEFRGEGSLEGWLVRIVASACRRIGRGEKNDASRHDTDADPVDDGDSPETTAARHELGELLNEALLELSPEDRLVLLLAEVEGQSGEEIGKAVGLSHGAVRTRLTRLRGKLRKALAPVLGEPEETP